MVLMKHECMLDIQSVMAYVIRNEVVDFLDDARLYINRKCTPKYSLENYANAYHEFHSKSLECNSQRNQHKRTLCHVQDFPSTHKIENHAI